MPESDPQAPAAELDRTARALAATPGDPAALLAACAARARSNDIQGALQLLRTHVAARTAASIGDLETTLRAMAAADPDSAVECHWVLAREQLRFGDIEGSRRTLDEIPTAALTGALALRVHSLRASALFRIGDAAAAEQELELAKKESRSENDLSLALSLAEYSVARCELRSARESLRAMAAETALIPHLEARRATALAMSYLFEERYAHAATWAKRARLAQRRQGLVEPLAVMIEMLALLGRGELNRAIALSTRYAPHEERSDEALGRGIRVLYEAATAWRRGDFRECLIRAEPGFRELDRRADQVARGVVAHYLARAALGLGEIERAEQFAGYLSALESELGLALLLPTLENDRAAIAEAKGDRDAARDHLRRARRLMPRAPYSKIEAWALAAGPGEPPPAIDREPEAATNYLSLRTAERALEDGNIVVAQTSSKRAARWYRSRALNYELARALLASAEAYARAGDPSAAKAALADCEAIARPRGYARLIAAAELVRAFNAASAGELATYRAALSAAREAAGRELTDPSLAAACRRAGLAAEATAHTDVHPFAAIVDRLRLARPAVRELIVGAKVYLLAEDDPPPGAIDAILDVDRHQLIADRRRVELTPRSSALLEIIARAGAAGATAETLYIGAWSATEYHALRHRNGVYVAINRLRAAIEPLLGAEAITATYAIRAGLTIAVSRAIVG